MASSELENSMPQAGRQIQPGQHVPVFWELPAGVGRVLRAMPCI